MELNHQLTQHMYAGPLCEGWKVNLITSVEEIQVFDHP